MSRRIAATDWLSHVPDAPTSPERSPRTGSGRGRFRRIASQVATLLVVVMIGGWVLWLRPPVLGGDTQVLIVRGLSMEPTYGSGDLVLVRPNETYRAGDVLAYRVPEGEVGAGTIVIHRIVGGDPVAGFTTRGDNNDSDDSWRPTSADVVGTARLHVPAVGRIGEAIRSTLGVASLTGAISGWIVYSGWHPPTRRVVRSELPQAADERS